MAEHAAAIEILADASQHARFVPAWPCLGGSQTVLQRSAAMDALRAKLVKPEMSGQVPAYVQAAAEYVTHPSTQYRAVAGESRAIALTASSVCPYSRPGLPAVADVIDELPRYT